MRNMMSRQTDKKKKTFQQHDEIINHEKYQQSIIMNTLFASPLWRSYKDNTEGLFHTQDQVLL